jgi:hypothetical protein
MGTCPVGESRIGYAYVIIRPTRCDVVARKFIPSDIRDPDELAPGRFR